MRKRGASAAGASLSGGAAAAPGELSEAEQRAQLGLNPRLHEPEERALSRRQAVNGPELAQVADGATAELGEARRSGGLRACRRRGFAS
jgi:hypothetical protein